MKETGIPHIHIGSLNQFHDLLGFSKPRHPLFTVLQFKDFPKIDIDQRVKITADFYQITFKKDCGNKMIYGQSVYDFDEGVLSFFSPKQVFIKEGELIPPAGFIIFIHPDYLKSYALESKIRQYGFFGYAANEALILSEEEESFIENIFEQIEKEFYRPVDIHSQDVIISSLELLFSYANRFYTRQFIMRKPHYNTLLSKFEKLMNDLFREEVLSANGIPSVTTLADHFNFTAKYFSDLLKQHTGRSAQQHIHDRIVDLAKEKLLGTELSVSEIAYQLGFEYPQSFSKLFKVKTTRSPIQFRNSLIRDNG